MEEIKDQITEELISIYPKDEILWDVTGEQVDSGTFLTGEPECFMIFNKTVGEGLGIVNILCNAAASCGIPTELIENRGAALLSLIDVLEDLGFRVRVTLGQAVTG